ncbi:MAG TPA: protein kinase [Thermoanaerobaculia bacterium]|nr:protein kinase [Thermoanaerobaculia bacterium]
MESYARAGQWRRAAQLAAELLDDEKLVFYSLMAAFGRVPEGRSFDLFGAAELLAAQGRHEDAILLFERAGAFLQAGEASRAARDLPRAAGSYKKAGAWLKAARCYEEAGRLQEALQVVEEGCRSLERSTGGSPAGASRIAELTLARADLLLRSGRGDTAVRLLGSLPPSPGTAELLARAGRYSEAVQCYLKLGRIEEASRLAAKNPEGGRLQAQILLQTGRPAEAGELLARHGLNRESADAYEAAVDWGRAAYRWEAAQELVRAAQAYEKAGRPRDAARCYEAAGMPRRAAEVSSRTPSGTGSVPRHDSRQLQIARGCLAAGDKARAASLLLQIRPEEDGFGESAILLAPLLIEEGFAQNALDRLNQIPRDAALRIEMEIEYWAGRSHEALGQTAAAIICFERVAARAPGHRDALERLERLQNPPEAPIAPVAPAPAVERATRPTVFPEVGGMLAERYEILSEIGRGGMGRVYKAHDRELDELVAIKTLLAPDEGVAEETRLLREVQICRRISHPNVVRVYDIGRFAGGLFVTMEHIEGRTLEKVVAEESPLPFARIRSYLCEIASGLQEAHGQGIIHRDLKPGNVMVTESRLKILDFGIASMAGIGARLTQAGCVMGTPMYMAPDQFRGREPDSRSDLYSLGLLAYTLIAGREPFDLAEPTILAIKQLHEDPLDIRERRPETSERWRALLARLLAKDPQDRFQTAHEVLDALTKLPV